MTNRERVERITKEVAEELLAEALSGDILAPLLPQIRSDMDRAIAERLMSDAAIDWIALMPDPQLRIGFKGILLPMIQAALARARPEGT